jgi:catechol-2,3-dioxygenase/quercetin dioxygenase-like cupin family protein
MTITTEPALLTEDGEGETWWFLGTRTVVRNPQGRHTLPLALELTIPPGGAPPLHVHDTLDDSFYVLDGELVVRCGDRLLVAAAGSYVSLPASVPHAFRVVSARPARLLTVHHDASFLGLVEEIGLPATGPGLPTDDVGRVDLDALAEANARHGSRVLGPSITEDEARAFLADQPGRDDRPAIRGVDHIELTVTDLAASEAWYRDVFDLVRVSGATDGAGHGHVALLHQTTGLVIALASTDEASPAGLRHLALAVDDRRALCDARSDAQQRGFEPGTITDAPYGSGFVLRDPDGIEVELFAAAPPEPVR